ncbi:MAG TPA: Asp-tRNA(Asn)/Glu-tRNA(Gln) amidotransferase subunit GatC [Candidatus Paceibacterota bacterium]
MITREEIIKLATLSRLKLSEDEITHMQKDMGAILAYVDKLKSAPIAENGPIMSVNKNVMREDANPHAGGAFTKKLIDLAPKKEGTLFKVKKILGGSSQ